MYAYVHICRERTEKPGEMATGFYLFGVGWDSFGYFKVSYKNKSVPLDSFKLRIEILKLTNIFVRNHGTRNTPG